MLTAHWYEHRDLIEIGEHTSQLDALLQMQSTGESLARVVNSRGEVSLRSDEGRAEQLARLELEGIVRGANGRIDLRAYGWEAGDSGTDS